MGCTKLRDLSGSKESIENLSHWMQFHRKRIKQLVPVWYQELQRDCSHGGRKVLTYFYVCNDTMMGSKSKGKDMIEEFGKAIPAALKHATRNCNEKTRSELQRLLQIWADRRIFGANFIEEM